jgi:hypothetical protein
MDITYKELYHDFINALNPLDHGRKYCYCFAKAFPVLYESDLLAFARTLEHMLCIECNSNIPVEERKNVVSTDTPLCRDCLLSRLQVMEM